MAIWPLAYVGRLRSPGTIVVLSVHGLDVAFADRPSAKGRLYRIYLRLAARLLRSARVIANSDATARRVTAIGFNHVATVPLATRQTAEQKANVASERFVLFAGRLTRRKGLSWFVSAVLPSLPPDVVLKVAGTVWDASEQATLENDRVLFLGPLDQERLFEFMARALCVVVPNIPMGGGHFEGFGLVAVEAAVAGGVVVASRIDGLTDAVVDGATGFLLEPRDASKWVEQITAIASWSEEARSAFTSNARRTAIARYSWDRVARETIAIYERGVPTT